MNISEFKQQIVSYLETSGKTQAQLAEQAKVSQSQVSLWFNGKVKRISNNSRRVIEIIENYNNSDKAPIPEEVAQAVRAFCNGDNNAAKALANMINSLTSLKNK